MLAEVERRRSSPVFVGRRRELERLALALAEAAAGRPSTMLVAGDAGIGKSRLVGEFLALARASPAAPVILEGGCTDLGGTGLPYEPIIEALRSLVGQLDPSDLEAAIGVAGPGLAPLLRDVIATDAPGESMDPAMDRQRTFDAVVRLLEHTAARQPLIVVQEDLHWADASTRDLLAFLVRKLRTGRIGVVLTYRSDEIHRSHPLLGWLAEIQRLRGVERIDVARFGREEVAEQVRGILGEEPSGSVLEAIERRAGGNPFFVEELMAALDDGKGRVPQTIRDITLAMLGRLADGPRSIVAMTAVAGGQVEEAVLTRALGDGLDKPESDLRAALESRLVKLEPLPGGTAIGFRHALLHEAVEDALLPGETRKLHASLATALEASDEPGRLNILAAVAHHWSAADDRPRTLVASLAAARAAFNVFAFPDSLRHYERALAVWPLVPGPDRPAEDYAQICLEASRAAGLAGLPARAIGWASLALDASVGSADVERTAEIEERLAWAAIADDQLELANRTLESAVGRLEGRPPSAVAARVTAAYARDLAITGRRREAREVAERAIRIARRVDDRLAEAAALSTLGNCLALSGDCEQAIRTLEQAIEVARAIGDPWEIIRGHGNLADALFWCGQVVRSDDTIGQALSIAGDLGAHVGLVHWLRVDQAYRWFEAGRWTDASELLESVPVEDLGGDYRGRYAAIRAYLALLTGALPQAHDAINLGHGEGISFDGRWHEWILVLSSQLAIEEGRLADAEAGLLDGLSAGDQSKLTPGDRSMALRIAIGILADLAEQAQAEGDHEAVERHRRRGEDCLERIRHGVGAMDDPESKSSRWEVGELRIAEAEATRLDARPDPSLWAAAASHWRAIPEPWRTAYCELHEAEARLLTGEARRTAVPLLRAAHETATALGAAPLSVKIESLAHRAAIDIGTGSALSPQARSAPRDPHGLTRREADVLRLLADGLSNREIADRLFISESTAGVHVSNILGKLGVASRAAAAAIGARLALAEERSRPRTRQ
jgi:DNA-binding CsgD family transcriptional regulator/tetratricopeptide (TPR) repeat protein